MDIAIVIAFYVLVAVIAFRVPRIHLAVTFAALVAILAVSLVLQATVTDRLGSYIALGSAIAMAGVGIALRWGPDSD